MYLKIFRLLATFTLFVVAFTESVQASWAYTSGSTGTQNGFTYQATVTESPTNTFNGTAVLSAFSGSSASIPATVPIRITVNTTNLSGQPIQYNEWVNCTVKGFSGFMLNSDASFSGDVNIIGNFNLNGNDLTVNGDVIHQSGSINFGTIPSGSLKTQIKFSITGTYLQQRDADNNGTYETYCSGGLWMNNAADYLYIGGNASFCSYSGYSGTMSSGTVEVRGSFAQKVKLDVSGSYYGSSSYAPTGTHKTVLSGITAQTVSFENPDLSFFRIVEVTNPSGIVIDTNVKFTTLLASGVTLSFSATGGIISGTLGTNAKFTGGARISQALYLGGHNLEVNGNVTGGYISLDGGRLEITGDFNGFLGMINTADYLVVTGNAVFAGGGYSAGTAELKGNFTAKPSGYPASGTHRTLLSGTGTQTVTFENVGSSYFKTLDVTNPLADTSTVSITSGGNLKLGYTGTYIVSALYLGGIMKANGLYSSTNTGGLITGTGKIQVGAFASYASWVSANAPGQTTDLDHDCDGVTNGIEYFMGKTGNDFTANPGIVSNGTVTWPKSPAFSGIYAVQTSADLVEWTDVTEDAVQVTKNIDSVVWKPLSGPGSRFVRLLVTPN